MSITSNECLPIFKFIKLYIFKESLLLYQLYFNKAVKKSQLENLLDISSFSVQDILC